MLECCSKEFKYSAFWGAMLPFLAPTEVKFSLNLGKVLFFPKYISIFAKEKMLCPTWKLMFLTWKLMFSTWKHKFLSWAQKFLLEIKTSTPRVTDFYFQSDRISLAD